MIKLLRYSLLSLLLLSCASTKNAESIEASILVSYKYSNEITVGNRADVILTNETSYCLIFPLIDGISIYTEINGTSVQIENLVEVLGDQNLIISPKGETLSSRIVTLRPDTSNLETDLPINFTVRLTGYLCDDKDVKIIKEIPFTAIP